MQREYARRYNSNESGKEIAQLYNVGLSLTHYHLTVVLMRYRTCCPSEKMIFLQEKNKTKKTNNKNTQKAVNTE